MQITTHVSHLLPDVCTSIHSIVEMFSVMTWLPPRYRISPASAFHLVEQTQDIFSIVELESAETVKTIEDFVTRGLGGGTIYDALIVACARKRKASKIYTLNKKHFDVVAPDLAPLIREP